MLTNTTACPRKNGPQVKWCSIQNTGQTTVKFFTTEFSTYLYTAKIGEN